MAKRGRGRDGTQTLSAKRAEQVRMAQRRYRLKKKLLLSDLEAKVIALEAEQPQPQAACSPGLATDDSLGEDHPATDLTAIPVGEFQHIIDTLDADAVIKLIEAQCSGHWLIPNDDHTRRLMNALPLDEQKRLQTRFAQRRFVLRMDNKIKELQQKANALELKKKAEPCPNPTAPHSAINISDLVGHDSSSPQADSVAFGSSCSGSTTSENCNAAAPAPIALPAFSEIWRTTSKQTCLPPIHAAVGRNALAHAGFSASIWLPPLHLEK
ncbi:hypothetical protein HDU83_006486 [Entophlyctis luteolus]|nr:hypothetical protein HDU83_006486 [Entophlyctis luteolus]